MKPFLNSAISDIRIQTSTLAFRISFIFQLPNQTQSPSERPKKKFTRKSDILFKRKSFWAGAILNFENQATILDFRIQTSALESNLMIFRTSRYVILWKSNSSFQISIITIINSQCVFVCDILVVCIKNTYLAVKPITKANKNILYELQRADKTPTSSL